MKAKRLFLVRPQISGVEMQEGLAIEAETLAEVEATVKAEIPEATTWKVQCFRWVKGVKKVEELMKLKGGSGED